MTEDQKKYLKAAIMTAVSVAGVGAFVRNWKAKKDRKKVLDVENGKNTIVIPIVKEDFMRGIPNPDERADEMDGKIVEKATDPSKEEGAFGKVFNFFRKKASEEVKKENTEAKQEDASAPINEKKVSEEKIDGRIVLRGQDGKFVSPTDPVAVKDVEKTAQMGFVDSLLNPSDFAKNVGKAVKEHPLWMTGGIVGSIILASKIVDYLAKKRRQNAENRLEDARDSYVSLLENGNENEKKAEVDVPKVTGTVLGTAFLLPMALTAMVANKIIENRDEERKRKKSMMNSYPQDPTFLYNVVGGEKIAMSTDRALSLMMFKTAMVASCEEGSNEKTADWRDGVNGFVNGAKNLLGNVKGFLNNETMNTEDARDAILKLLEDNPNEMLDIIKERAYGNKDEAAKKLTSLASSKKGGGLGGRLFRSGYSEPEKKNELENAIYTSPRLTKLVADRFTDDKFKDSYGAFADEMIGKRLGLRQGSFLHKIITWLMGLFGVRNNLIKSEIENKMRDISAPISEERKKWESLNATRSNLDQASQNKLESTKNLLDSTPQARSPESWNNETSMDSLPSNADYEHLSYENGQAPNPDEKPKPNVLLDSIDNRPWFERIEGSKGTASVPAPTNPNEPVNPKERLPDRENVAWGLFKQLPRVIRDKSLNRIVDLGMDQFDYNARMKDPRPITPVNRGNGEIPVNVGLVNRELGVGEAYDENGAPVLNRVENKFPQAGNKPIASPIMTR